MNRQHLHSHQEVPNQTKALPLSYKVSSTAFLARIQFSTPVILILLVVQQA